MFVDINNSNGTYSFLVLRKDHSNPQNMMSLAACLSQKSDWKLYRYRGIASLWLNRIVIVETYHYRGIVLLPRNPIYCELQQKIYFHLIVLSRYSTRETSAYVSSECMVKKSEV